MNTTYQNGRALACCLSSLLAVSLTACIDRGDSFGRFDLSQSTVASSVTQLTADGRQAAQVTVTLRGPDGQPLVGLAATLAVDGSATQVTQPVTVSDANGQLVGFVSAAAPGEKTVTAWVNLQSQMAQVPRTAVIGFVADANTNVMSNTNTSSNSNTIATHLGLSYVSPVTAGTTFAVTVNALDDSNQTVTAYTGTVQVSTTNPNAIVPTAYTFGTGDLGVHTLMVRLDRAGTWQLNAQDTHAQASQAMPISVVPAGVTQLVASGLPSAAVRGSRYPVTLTLRDSFGNIATNTVDTLHFASSDTHASLPGNAALTAADAGTAVFEIGLFTNGVQTVTATDLATQASVTLSAINVSGFSAVAMSAGQSASSTCALFDNNQVKCWGTNPNGNLGYGDVVSRGATTAGMGANLPFVNLGTGRTAVQVTSGGAAFFGLGDIACAVLDNHSAKCWGYNAQGALGYGDTTERHAPAVAAIPLGARTAQSLSVGGSHVCALLDNNQVTCWGDNTAGQLGTGDYTAHSAPPAAVNLGTGRTATRVATGYAFSCAILDNGQVACWGNNTHGQLGLGDTSYRNAPTALGVGTGRTAMELSLGATHACATLDNGQVTCWGYNGDGQLGLGDTADRSTPTAAAALGTGRTASKLNAENDGTCVVLDNHTLTCMGYNAQGQLGLGDTVNRSVAPSAPINVGAGRTVLAVSGGVRFTCALLDTAQITCFGANPLGQLGLGDTQTRGDTAASTPNNYDPTQLW